MASIRENRDLREFIVEDVLQTEDDRVLGTGSYGTVEEVQLQVKNLANIQKDRASLSFTKP